jgi:ATP phosphoribosyltransferase
VSKTKWLKGRQRLAPVIAKVTANNSSKAMAIGRPWPPVKVMTMREDDHPEYIFKGWVGMEFSTGVS